MRVRASIRELYVHSLRMCAVTPPHSCFLLPASLRTDSVSHSSPCPLNEQRKDHINSFVAPTAKSNTNTLWWTILAWFTVNNRQRKCRYNLKFCSNKSRVTHAMRSQLQSVYFSLFVKSKIWDILSEIIKKRSQICVIWKGNEKYMLYSSFFWRMFWKKLQVKRVNGKKGV